MPRVIYCSAKAPARRTLRFASHTRARRISPAISNAALAPLPHVTPGGSAEGFAARSDSGLRRLRRQSVGGP